MRHRSADTLRLHGSTDVLGRQRTAAAVRDRLGERHRGTATGQQSISDYVINARILNKIMIRLQPAISVKEWIKIKRKTTSEHVLGFQQLAVHFAIHYSNNDQ